MIFIIIVCYIRTWFFKWNRTHDSVQVIIVLLRCSVSYYLHVPASDHVILMGKYIGKRLHGRIIMVASGVADNRKQIAILLIVSSVGDSTVWTTTEMQTRMIFASCSVTCEHWLSNMCECVLLLLILWNLPIYTALIRIRNIKMRGCIERKYELVMHVNISYRCRKGGS